MQEKTPGKLAGRLLVLSGPSGSGKSTVCRRAVQGTAAQLSISATTRPRTDQDVQGKDYYFLSEKEFLEQVERGEFLEYARVFDHYYGTPFAAVRELLAEGKTVILEIDVQGAAQVFEKMPEAVGVFVAPPSKAELRRRLETRGRDSQETIEKRLAEAKREIDAAHSSSHYRYEIINDELECAVQEMIDLIEGKASGEAHCE